MTHVFLQDKTKKLSSAIKIEIICTSLKYLPKTVKIYYKQIKD